MDLFKQSLNKQIDEMFKTNFNEVNISNQSCGFGTPKMNIIESSQLDFNFSKPYTIAGFVKQYNPYSGNIEEIAILRYPMTVGLPKNLPKSLHKMMKNKVRILDYLEKLQSTTDDKNVQEKNNQIELSKEDFLKLENIQEYDDCQWTQTFLFCQNQQKMYEKLDEKNKALIDEILKQMKHKLLIVDEEDTLPRGEDFLEFKHLHKDGINYIKYNKQYIIQFQDMQQLIIIFTRLFMDNYNPKIDNDLFNLIKKGNQIFQNTQPLLDKQNEDDQKQDQKINCQLQRKQSLQQEELKHHKKKMIKKEDDLQISQDEESLSKVFQSSNDSNEELNHSLNNQSLVKKEEEEEGESIDYYSQQSKDTQSKTNLLVNQESKSTQKFVLSIPKSSQQNKITQTLLDQQKKEEKQDHENSQVSSKIEMKEQRKQRRMEMSSQE